jgi:phasin
MADQPFTDFIPPEMRKLAEQNLQQAQKTFEEMMNATHRAVSSFGGHASTAHSTALELQRKLVGYSERNVAASLEYAQNLLRAKDASELMKLHSEYLKTQIQALTDQARDLTRHAGKTANPQKDG